MTGMESSMKTEPGSFEAEEWVFLKSDGLLPLIKRECLEQESPSSKLHSGAEPVKCESPPDPMKTVFIKMEPLDEEEEHAIGPGADPLDAAESGDLGNPALKDHGAGESFCLEGRVESQSDPEPCSCRPHALTCRAQVERVRHAAIPSGEEPYSLYRCEPFARLSDHGTTRAEAGQRSTSASAKNSTPEDNPSLGSNKPHKCETRLATLGRSREHCRPSGTLSETRPYRCRVCPASFRRPDDFRQHLGTHSTSRLFRCPVCSASFTQSELHREHLVTHPEYHLHWCKTCPASFRHPWELSRHTRTHSKSERYRCTECPASFKSPGKFRQHLGAHSKSGPYQCTMCSASFVRPGQYRQHLGYHSELQKARTTLSVQVQTINLIGQSI